MAALPSELWLHVFSNLDVSDLLNIKFASQLWRHLSRHNSIWKRLTLQYCPFAEFAYRSVHRRILSAHHIDWADWYWNLLWSHNEYSNPLFTKGEYDKLAAAIVRTTAVSRVGHVSGQVEFFKDLALRKSLILDEGLSAFASVWIKSRERCASNAIGLAFATNNLAVKGQLSFYSGSGEWELVHVWFGPSPRLLYLTLYLVNPPDLSPDHELNDFNLSQLFITTYNPKDLADFNAVTAELSSRISDSETDQRVTAAENLDALTPDWLIEYAKTDPTNA